MAPEKKARTHKKATQRALKGELEAARTSSPEVPTPQKSGGPALPPARAHYQPAKIPVLPTPTESSPQASKKKKRKSQAMTVSDTDEAPEEPTHKMPKYSQAEIDYARVRVEANKAQEELQSALDDVIKFTKAEQMAKESLKTIESKRSNPATVLEALKTVEGFGIELKYAQKLVLLREKNVKKAEKYARETKKLLATDENQ